MKLSKKARVLAAALALTLAAGIMGGCGGDKKEEAAAKKTVNVGIVQLVEHASLDAANKGFVDGLAAKQMASKKAKMLFSTARMHRRTRAICRILLTAL